MTTDLIEAPAELSTDVREPEDPGIARNNAVAEMLAGAYAKASQLQLTPEESEQLVADFPDEAFSRGARGNDNLIYIEHAYLRERLNKVLGIGQAVTIRRREWTEASEYQDRDGNKREKITLYVDLILVVRGCLVGEAIADSDYYPHNNNTTYSDALESAESDAFRRCAKKFGVGLQAWMKGWTDGWKQRNGYKPNGSAAPGAGSSTSHVKEPKCPACGSGVWHNPENVGTKKPVWKCKNKDNCKGGSKGYPWASWETDPFTRPEDKPQEPPPEPPSYGPKGTELKEYVTETLGLTKSTQVAEWLSKITGAKMNAKEAVAHFQEEALAAQVLEEIQRVKSEKGLTDEQIKDGSPF